MKRLLIAMLALLTGLAVQAAPATARDGGVAVGAELGTAAANRGAQTARTELPKLDRKRPEFAAPDSPQQSCMHGGDALAAPTVRIGPDRARE